MSPTRDDARATTRVIIPHQKREDVGLMVQWDHRFQSLNITHRDGKNMQMAVLQAQRLFKSLDVRPEELRAVADEIEQGQNAEDISMPDLCKRAIDSIDVRGKDVLDIGGYDGAMAAYALERGARNVAVLDNCQWSDYGWPEPVMPAGVDFIPGSLFDPLGGADIVLCFNVIYHIKDVHGALRELRKKTFGTMLLCTLYVYSDLPVWRVYEPREVNPEDDTVYWAPSSAGLAKSLRVCGWSEVEEIGRSAERMVVKCHP